MKIGFINGGIGLSETFIYNLIKGGNSFGSKIQTSYVKNLKEEAKASQNIRFHGPKSPQEVLVHLNKCSIFVVPSIWNDPCPLTVLEGMAAGKVVVTSNKGGIPELIGDAGIIINPLDISSFSSVLLEHVSNKEKVVELGKKSKKKG